MPEYHVNIGGNVYTVNIGRVEDDRVEVRLGDRTFTAVVESPSRSSPKTPKILREMEVPDASASPDRTSPPGEQGNRGDVLSPLPGNILKILVQPGDTVTTGQVVAILEAMKMENEIESPLAGPVTRIHVREGDTVLENTLIMSIG